MYANLISLKIFLSILFCCTFAKAEWGAVAQTSGYLGTYAVGATYETTNEHHFFDMGLGMSPGIVESDVYQLNLKYVFSPFEYEFGASGYRTNIVGIGVMAARCLCDETFIHNLSVYPEANYYDETAWRFGLVFENTLRHRDFQIYWNWVLLDQIAIAGYNNPHIRDYPLDYWSAGIGIRYFGDWF
jgi:hypothetical protein